MRNQTLELINNIFNVMKTIKETNEDYRYYMSVPGYKREDFEIKLLIEKDFVTITVTSKKSTIFASGYYAKIVALTEDVVINKDSVKANCEDGVLEVILPKKIVTEEFIL